MRPADVAVVIESDTAYVLNLAYLETQQSPYVFEGPSFEIWTRIDGTRTEDQIVDQLTALYEAPREQIAADVHSFIEQLLNLHLIEESQNADRTSKGPGDSRDPALD